MRKRIAELDVIRAVAALAVVLIHVTASPLASLPTSSRSFFWYSLVNQWSRFSIPAFVLVTGVVLFYTYGRRDEFRVGEFMSKRLNAIALPYLFWTLLYLLWRARIEGNLGQLPQNLAWSLLRGDAMYQLYFIVLIFQYYLLFPLVRPLGKSRWLLPVLGLALGLQFLLMWDTYYGLFKPTTPWVVSLLIWRDRLFPWWIGYFTAGLFIAAKLESVLDFTRRHVWPLLAGAAGLLAWVMLEYMRTVTRPGVSVGFAATGFRPSAYIYSLLTIFALLGFGGWILPREGWFKAALLEFGKHSFGIFLVHPLVLDITVRLLARFHLSPSLYLLLVSPIVLAGSYLFSRLAATLPFGHWIVGRT